MPIKTPIKQASGWFYFNSPRGRAELRGAGVILMLHRVLADDASAALPHRNELCVGPRAFEGLLRWLPRHFDCVSLMDLLQSHKAPRGDCRPKVALTFDDGWRDNAVNAFPLLQRHQVPASIFLSTDYIGSRQRFWWESVGETLWGSHGEEARRQLIERLRKLGRPLPAAYFMHDHSKARSLVLARYLQTLKSLSPQALHVLTDACPTESLPQAMDWQQVRALEDSGLVRFGPHGASHALLPYLDDHRLNEELTRSHAALNEGCRAPLPVYCYPNGDHDERVRAQVAAHRYPYALSTRPGICQGLDDPLALPRIGVSQRNASRPSLLAWRISRGERG
ncbi:polysaccharide deacetylase family protein [Pseudomonas soli]|uniref:Polysaccharide deacetylase family protein n=1 Tax=Pseudomonas soli TaxID=1306993 RepID=A0ABU7GIY7_9PSED|nr:polysaccharide deacetylase family protein [Pseudomonas soli]MDT3712361.1 polysaccharide deacetylase family protein [Pseudomonas soli]MDT3729698.1 polysaccharide deacetylase family protein [Pseudomonas soli]MEE1879024.1 polysaccharide deacetylase family protein [Pseudomonas soli]NBK41056.1 polysaccharide deacetylase family protein [Pseudomonas soli]WJO24466.1 polysaccharide deacetylase family protein [Pseudomonas soli]